MKTKTLAREKVFFKKLIWSPKMIGQPVGPLKGKYLFWLLTHGSISHL